MKLADLVYEIAKDSIEFKSGFNFEGFIRGDYDDDRDFSTQISFAFNYINLAFSRLRSMEKTILSIGEATTDQSGYAEFTDGDITAVVDRPRAGYHNVGFFPFGKGIAVEHDFAGKIIFIEYRKYIPHFTLDSIRKQTLDENGKETYEAIDVDLTDFGITDDMCSFVKEYAKGGLTEYLSPELSNRHTQMAEAYFASLKTQYTKFPQREIVDVIEGGGAF